MKTIGTINVLIVGCVSAVMHAATAVVFIPVISAVFLGQRLGPLQSFSATAENVMVMVALSPLCWAVLGFIFGATMAFLYNLFSAALARREIQDEKAVQVAAAGRHAA